MWKILDFIWICEIFRNISNLVNIFLKTFHFGRNHWKISILVIIREKIMLQYPKDLDISFWKKIQKSRFYLEKINITVINFEKSPFFKICQQILKIFTLVKIF